MIRSYMADRRWWGRRSYSILVLVVLLITATGLTLVHWHRDWSVPGCGLCHVRNLPSLHSSIADGLAVPVDTEHGWQAEEIIYEPSVFSLTESSRAPPAFIFFTV